MQIAEDAVKNGIVFSGEAFSEAINQIIKKKKPNKIIETGTYLGEGSTKVIADAPNRYWYLIEKLNGANIEQD